MTRNIKIVTDMVGLSALAKVR
jgi:hypothetical protein